MTRGPVPLTSSAPLSGVKRRSLATELYPGCVDAASEGSEIVSIQRDSSGTP